MTNFAPAKLKGATHSTTAPVAKLVDALDLGSSNASCVGSSPIRRTFLKCQTTINQLFDIFLIFSEKAQK